MIKPNLSITVRLMRLGQVSSALDMASIPIYHLRRVNLGRPLCDRNIYVPRDFLRALSPPDLSFAETLYASNIRMSVFLLYRLALSSFLLLPLFYSDELV